MAISINPIFPVIAAQDAAPDVVLQPGTVINAQVLKVLANDMVRIAIANLSIEVMSEIPLQPGQTLQLAVSQMPEGIRLAVVGQGGSSSSAAQPAAAITDTVTLAPDTPINAMTKPAAVSQSTANQLTALEALAVSAAAQTAATKQASMSQLFANLGTAAASDALPPLVQQAAMQLLARRPPLDAALSGDEIKTAFETSGLFLEKTLATGAPSGTGGNAMPDLKAALVVFRQLLSAQLGDVPATGSPQPQATSSQGAMPHGSQTASPQIAAAGEPSHGAGLAQPPGGATLVPELDVQEILLPQARVPVADDFSDTGELFRFVTPGIAATTGAATAATADTRIAMNLMQEALAASGEGALPGQQARVAAVVDEGAFAHTNTPPPPIRDALPSPQPVATATLAPGASASETAHHLLQDTDAAIARQTLLQVASLPDRADATTLRNDAIGPRWNFEIPFATPLGTAVAQFEIARDGNGNDVEAAKRVWRARFSLDVEPAGPVHAVVSLIGDTTSVRMWAERPATASRLRAGASQLSQALSHAELTPGDIVIRDGTPPQTATAQAGHFLDRAL